jgi:rhamnosyltransferase subunit B
MLKYPIKRCDFRLSLRTQTKRPGPVRKILLTTFGSYGDLHPFLAMGRVLKSHGDEVTVATHVDYRDQVERLGIRFVPIKPGLEEVGPQEEWAHKANHAFNGVEFIIKSLVLPYLKESYDAIKSTAVGHDLIISHVLTFASPIVAEELGIPWLSTALQPSPFFSAYDPPALGFLTFLPRLKFIGPKWMGRLLKLLALPTKGWLRPLASLRADAGLPPSSKNALVEGFSPHGTIALFPSAFAAPQPDWPTPLRQVGFPLFDEETTSEISPGLRQFLASGEPPVVFTLGTAIVQMETSYFEVAYEAMKQLGGRAVFLVGKQPRRLPPSALSDPNIHVSSYEPFSGLFPHAAAIVHQCGIGTTAQALASGRPQVPVPFAHDQPDNARRIVELGLGHAVPARRLNVSRLVTALSNVTQTDEFSRRASNFVTEMQVGGFEQRLKEAISDSLSR